MVMEAGALVCPRSLCIARRIIICHARDAQRAEDVHRGVAVVVDATVEGFGGVLPQVGLDERRAGGVAPHECLDVVNDAVNHQQRRALSHASSAYAFASTRVAAPRGVRHGSQGFC